eukprot:4074183-Prymnesium_polylepis.2
MMILLKDLVDSHQAAPLLQYVVNGRARCAPSGSGTDLESHSGSGRGLGADPASSNIIFTLTPGR